MAAEGCLGISASAPIDWCIGGARTSVRSPAFFFLFFIFLGVCTALHALWGASSGIQEGGGGFLLVLTQNACGKYSWEWKEPRVGSGGGTGGLHTRKCCCVRVHGGLVICTCVLAMRVSGHPYSSHILSHRCLSARVCVPRAASMYKICIISLSRTRPRACVVYFFGKPRVCSPPGVRAHLWVTYIYIFIYIYRLLYAAALLRLLGFGPL